MYEALSGNLPFNSHSYFDLVAQHLGREPAELRAFPDFPLIPEALKTVVLRCLQKDPAARFQHANELAAALEQIPPRQLRRKESKNSGIKLPQMLRSKALIGGAILAVALFVIGFWWHGIGSISSKEPQRRHRSTPGATQVAITFTSEPQGAYIFPSQGGPPLGRTPRRRFAFPGILKRSQFSFVFLMERASIYNLVRRSQW
jgi:serine/threonine protein kinase